MGYDGAVRKPALTVCLALLALLSAPGTVQAGKPSASSCALPASDLCTDSVWRGHRWASQPIPFRINVAVPLAGAEQDVVDAFAAWQNEIKSPQVEAAYPGDGSSITFVYLGPTTAGPSNDGVNTVFIGPAGGGTAGAAVRLRRKEILEFDITINSNVGWSTDLTCPGHNCGALDLQNVMTHEIGHALDLYHVSEPAQAELTMAPGAAMGETKKRDLGAGEVLALRRIYPA